MAKPSGGQEGNQNAAKGALVRNALRKVAVQNPLKLRKACEAVLDKAVAGDIGAFSVFRDTLDGKPNQSISGPDGGPLEAAIELTTRPQLTKEEWLKTHGVGTAARPTK